jgi:predicted nucleic acid-binding protein
MLVVDASVAIHACEQRHGFAMFNDARLCAPPLMWSECYSLVHEAQWRQEISPSRALALLARLDAGPVKRHQPRALHREAWRVADELGLAKTYDAEYIALARISDCRLVTLDHRLRRGADRLGIVFTPDEL